MKSSIITFVVLFSCICAQAQKLNLDKFEVKSNDITARTHPRQDINGNDCALVKVQLAAPNAIFDGNVIGDVAYNTSEYLVYMSQGSKRMTIKLEGYLPLEVNFEDYNIKSLEAKTVYVMTISGVSASNPIEPVRTKTGWIILNSDPSGASVYINDEFIGNTPITNYKQTYGIYNYRIEHPNYHPETGTIELNSGKTEKSLSLKPAFGAIAITSSVTGAKVLLDGKATNKVTPCTLEEVPSGQHTIIVQKDKYSPRQQNVTVEDGQTAKISITLDARFAQVSITSLDGAQIYCNRELKGTTKYLGDLMEGYYDIEARLAHHKTVTKQIQVVAGQSQEFSLNPTPIYGSLDVTSTPHDADVTIDGKSYGKTPLTIEQLLEGQHQVVISLKDYKNESRTVQIFENESAQIDAILNKKVVDIKNTSQGLTITLGDVQFKMISVEGGSFERYRGLEYGVGDVFQTVTVSSYSIGATEVTQGLWEAVMGSNPSTYRGKNRPVEGVTWDDCQNFIRKLNTITGLKFRLPTEAEWEFAARGGNKSNINVRKNKYISGSKPAEDMAWYGRSDGTHDVGTKLPNELGLYDMSGNVWEWCNDWYDNRLDKSPQINPKGPESGYQRVIRGGAWNSSAFDIHITQSESRAPSKSGSVFGFRLAL